MPFTLSHPAVILPLHGCARRHTSLPALVIGSMMPDLPYFLITGASGDFSHTLLGILAYCVPAGALVYLLYQVVLRDALVAWAPLAIAARMRPDPHWLARDARAAAVVLASLALGAASHLAWDACTHGGTLVSNSVGLLRAPVRLGGQLVPMFKVLQHLSTLVGFLVIAACLRAWYVRTPPGGADRPRASRGQRLFVFAAVSVATMAGGLGGVWLRSAHSVEHLLFNVVVSAMALAALTIVALCAGWKFRAARRREG